MQDCDSCKFPTIVKQVQNVSLSVFNVLTQAAKTGKLKADIEKVENRTSLCSSCEFLKENRCTECGCFIALKAGLEFEKCPKGKW